MAFTLAATLLLTALIGCDARRDVLCISAKSIEVCIGKRTGFLSSITTHDLRHELQSTAGISPKDCVANGPADVSLVAGEHDDSAWVTRNWSCPDKKFLQVQEHYGVDLVHDSVRWTVSITSNSTDVPWTTDIETALGFAHWDSDETRVWFGGPARDDVYPSADPQNFFDPYAAYPVGEVNVGRSRNQSRMFYGGQFSNIADHPGNNEDLRKSVFPVLMRLDEKVGFMLAQSLQNTPITAWHSAEHQGALGTWLKWTRSYDRFGGVGRRDYANAVEFSADFVGFRTAAHSWKPGVAWLQTRYSRFFEVDPRAEQNAFKASGGGAYADLRGAGDIDAAAGKLYMEMGLTLNWDSTARFPFHGEWAPTKEDGFVTSKSSNWTVCFAHAPPEHHIAEKCSNVSYAEISEWYALQEQFGVHVCQYGNLFEFGWNVASLIKARANCDGDFKSADPDAHHKHNLLCHTQRLLDEKRYKDALVFQQDKDGSPSKTELVCGGLDGSCIMDPHPDLPYLNHLLESASASIEFAEPTIGVCIDRQDWISNVNPNADDHATWFKGHPVRAMISSWKPAMEQFGEVWHASGKAVLINDHATRIDVMEHVDGIFAEMGGMHLGSEVTHTLNTGLACMNGPVHTWFQDPGKNGVGYDFVARGLQAHLLAGAHAMIPVRNNDHSVGGGCMPDECGDMTKPWLDYAAMFVALRGRRWVLTPDAAIVVRRVIDKSSRPEALVNAFTTNGEWIRSDSGETQKAMLISVVFATKEEVDVRVAGLRGIIGCDHDSAVVRTLKPGDKLDADGKAVPSTDGVITTLQREEGRESLLVTVRGMTAGATVLVLQCPSGDDETILM